MSRCALPQKKERVRMLLAAGLSHGKIAARTGFSRRTIARIAAAGRRKLTAADISDEQPAGFDPECMNRCRTCGGRIYLWPCLRCEIGGNVVAREEVRKLVRKRNGTDGADGT